MRRLSEWLSLAAGRQDVVLAVMLLTAVFMMIVPLPTALVDLLIAINLALSIVLLMIAIYIREPLEFSVFPSVLLITTLYRLALTISTSRLILMQHDAGEIVYTFGNFAVGGNLAVGLIVFTIITIVQFLVITKGAERVAEVGARFSLDGMPGKQMSIDGDMRAGIIDAAEAKRQRALVQKESQLYGAMDGAMKFVKGDAIASIIVILVNIIGGIAIGVFQQGMSAGEAGATFAVLSVGDGLIAQIPALLISITAGIIVTRVPGDKHQNLAQDLTEQLGRYPRSLYIAAAVLLVFGLIPGFPLLDFVLLAGAAAAAAWLVRRRGGVDAKQGTEVGAAVAQPAPGTAPLALRMAPGLAKARQLTVALDELRRQKFEQLGIPLSEVALVDDAALAADTLRIELYGEAVLQLRLPPQLVLADAHGAPLPDAAHSERLPFGGWTLQWVDEAGAASLASLGRVLHREEQQLAHCLALVIDRYAAEFIGVQETRYLMDAMEAKYAELVKELQRQLSIGKTAEVLQRLVEEGISIRDLRAVFEALIEWAPKEKDPLMLTEYVRIALRRHIIGRHRQGRAPINAWVVGDRIEALVRDSIRQTAAGSYCALTPGQTSAILAHISQCVARSEGRPVVLLTAIDVRRFLRKIVERELFQLPVLSQQELGDEERINLLGNIELIGEDTDALA